MPSVVGTTTNELNDSPKRTLSLPSISPITCNDIRHSDDEQDLSSPSTSLSCGSSPLISPISTNDSASTRTPTYESFELLKARLETSEQTSTSLRNKLAQAHKDQFDLHGTVEDLLAQLNTVTTELHVSQDNEKKLKAELAKANKRLGVVRSESASQKEKLGMEYEALSVNLFQEANELVRHERVLRSGADQRIKALESALEEKEEVLTQLKDAMAALRERFERLETAEQEKEEEVLEDKVVEEEKVDSGSSWNRDAFPCHIQEPVHPSLSPQAPPSPVSLSSCQPYRRGSMASITSTSSATVGKDQVLGLHNNAMFHFQKFMKAVRSGTSQLQQSQANPHMQDATVLDSPEHAHVAASMPELVTTPPTPSTVLPSAASVRSMDSSVSNITVSSSTSESSGSSQTPVESALNLYTHLLTLRFTKNVVSEDVEPTLRFDEVSWFWKKRLMSSITSGKLMIEPAFGAAVNKDQCAYCGDAIPDGSVSGRDSPTASGAPVPRAYVIRLSNDDDSPRIACRLCRQKLVSVVQFYHTIWWLASGHYKTASVSPSGSPISGGSGTHSRKSSIVPDPTYSPPVRARAMMNLSGIGGESPSSPSLTTPSYPRQILTKADESVYLNFCKLRQRMFLSRMGVELPDDRRLTSKMIVQPTVLHGFALGGQNVKQNGSPGLSASNVPVPSPVLSSSAHGSPHIHLSHSLSTSNPSVNEKKDDGFKGWASRFYRVVSTGGLNRAEEGIHQRRPGSRLSAGE